MPRAWGTVAGGLAGARAAGALSALGAPSHVMPVAAVVADGWTPHAGRVIGKADFGVFVDFGCERPGLLPARGSQAVDKPVLDAMAVGEALTVYVTGRQRETGKINLALRPVERRLLRLYEVIADGRTPYRGRVSSIATFGAFVDIGTELEALMPLREGADQLRVGDEVSVYVFEKRKDTGRVICTLEPASVPRRARSELIADGRTPYSGLVETVDPAVGAFIDIGCDTKAVLPLRVHAAAEVDEAVTALQPGDEVVVYVSVYSQHTGKVCVTLKPRSVPLLEWKDVIADGQTRYDGAVVGKTEYGAFVDIGCPYIALLPVRDAADSTTWEKIEVGRPLSVYVTTKSKGTGKISVSLRRAPRPRERIEAIVCDGQTPYEGRVIRADWFGVFVDIDCDNHGRIPVPEGGLEADERLMRLRPGDLVTTYVIEKREDICKVTLSLDRRDTPLVQWRDVVADGQTAYEGTVARAAAAVFWVDIAAERLGVLPRRGGPDEQGLEAGSSVRVYVERRNPCNGRMVFSLQRSESRRLTVGELLERLYRPRRGMVYRFDNAWAYIDLECEASGVLPRAAAHAALAVGDALLVCAVGFDAENGRVLLARARPPPPPRSPME